MSVSRGRIAVGAALFLAALAMLGQSSLYISVPLLLAGMLLLVWGIAPQHLKNFIERAPRSGIVLRGLDQLERIIEKPYSDENVDRRRELKNVLGFASGKFNEFYKLYEGGDEGAVGCIGELSDVVWAIIMQSLGEGEAQLFLSNAGLTAFHGGKPTAEVRINVERRIRRINDLTERIDQTNVSEHFRGQLWKDRMERIPLVYRANK